MHGFTCPDPEPDIHVVIPAHARSGPVPLPRLRYGTRQERRPGVRVSVVPRSVRLPAEDIATVSGLPVMTPERTVLDCALTLPVRQSVCVIDSAMRALCRPNKHNRVCEGADPEHLRAHLLQRLEALGTRRGIRRARAAIDLASPWAESPGESALRWLIHASGLEEPTLQEHWYDATEVKDYDIDLAWPEARVAVEFDGYAKYVSQEDLHQEKRREMRLSAGGWKVLRFDFRDLADTQRVVSRLQSVLPTTAPLPRPRDLWA